MALSPRALATFAVVADTVLPAVDGPGRGWTASASDLGVPLRFPELYERLPHPSVRREMRQLLGLLGSRGGGLMLYGKPRPFADLSPRERAEALRQMANSRLVTVRKGAKFLKMLAALLWVTTEPGVTTSPVWDAMGYPGPDGPPPQVPVLISTTPVTQDVEWTADVVIVGSGAGGGVAAGVLAQAGLDVVILEKGGYRNEAAFTHLEGEVYRDTYLDGLLGTTVDGGLVMIAGATLGGGTVVNYTTSFPTPQRVREEWDRVAGFSGVFDGSDYEASSRAVMGRLHVTKDFSIPSPRDALLEKGLRGRGWQVDAQPRNVDGCTMEDCGYCTMGCRIGAKRSTLLTYLQDAHEAGARIVVDADVRRVLSVNGRATGVEAVVGGSTLTVRARAIVLAAGSLNTPAILLRSGLGGKAVGRNLHLHPVTGVWGRFDEPIEPWSGILQARYSTEFSDLDGEGYGVIFETAPIHPVIAAAHIGWENAETYKRDILGLRHLSPIAIISRDHDGGRVTTRRDGSPLWKYRVSNRDQAHLREGVRRAAEVLAEAGASEVIATTIRPVRWWPRLDASVESFVADVDSVGYGPNQTSYGSWHQMSSAAMGSSPDSSVVRENNETHDTKGLYVMDGSCFPTASGVNPMISIQTIAHRGATALVAQLS